MIFRIAVLLAWTLALPGLVLAQIPSALMPSRPSVPSVSRMIPPTTTPGAPVATAPARPSLVDVNTADEKTLDTLPGIGPARAKSIVANRPYTEKQQLVEKKAVPANVLADIQDKIALVNVNKTTAPDIAKILPNVGPVRAQQIVDKRPYASLQDLVTKGALTQGVLDGLKGLVTTGL